MYLPNIDWDIILWTIVWFSLFPVQFRSGLKFITYIYDHVPVLFQDILRDRFDFNVYLTYLYGPGPFFTSLVWSGKLKTQEISNCTITPVGTK